MHNLRLTEYNRPMVCRDDDWTEALVSCRIAFADSVQIETSILVAYEYHYGVWQVYSREKTSESFDSRAENRAGNILGDQ